MEIKILFRQGKSIREISRIMKLSRNTVRRYLRREQKPNYKCLRPRRISKLSPFYVYLHQRIQAAHPQWLPATVLYDEIKAHGYPGSLSLLRSYLATHKLVKLPEVVVRFETNPGQQMQVDWIEFSRSQPRLSAFVAILGFSRVSFVEFVSDERLETLLACHQKAFEFFGGVTHEVLYDNMKTVVIQRNTYGKDQHRFQPGFLDFARHYGFVPRLCRPYRAKTKGKVERFNRYLRYSFYNPLASHLKPLGLKVDVELANYEVKRWLRDIANVRIHATTGQIPANQLDAERAYLQPLPPDYKRLSGCSHPSHRLSPVESLQHPLSIYDKLLQGECA